MQLLKKARKNDKVAITALYQRALPPIYRFVATRISEVDLVEDIVSDIFLEMVESLDTLRSDYEAGFFAWLFQIARTHISASQRQMIRTKTHQVTFPISPSDSGAYSHELLATSIESNPAALQEWREGMHELGAAIEYLTAEQQIVIVGRFLAGQSIEELAQVLDKHPGAIRALQFRALGVLAERLGFVRTPRNVNQNREQRGRA